MATLTVSLTEELELNGKNRGGEHTFSISSVTQAYTRVHTADNAIDLEDTKYIRVTNLDSSNEVVLSLQISNDEDGAADGSTSILLAAGQSYVMGVPHEGIACDDDAATPITDAALHDLESIIVDPKTNSVSVEVFNPYKARFARNVKKINPTTRYNLMRDIQEQRAMRGEEGSEVSDLELQKRLNRQAIPKSLLAMIAAGLLGKSAAQGEFASLIYPGQGPL